MKPSVIMGGAALAFTLIGADAARADQRAYSDLFRDREVYTEGYDKGYGAGFDEAYGEEYNTFEGAKATERRTTYTSPSGYSSSGYSSSGYGSTYTKDCIDSTDSTCADRPVLRRWAIARRIQLQGYVNVRDIQPSQWTRWGYRVRALARDFLGRDVIVYADVYTGEIVSVRYI